AQAQYEGRALVLVRPWDWGPAGAGLPGGANHRRRRRGARRDDFQSQLKPDAVRGAVLRQAADHDWRAAQVRDALLEDLLDNLLGIHLALADLARSGGGYRPGETPAVAVEQRHRPKVARLGVQTILHH